MAVIVLPIEKGTKKMAMVKIIANGRLCKTAEARRRAYRLRQNGHAVAWIAKKLGRSEAEVRELLAS